jgi:hypothetical protein
MSERSALRSGRLIRRRMESTAWHVRDNLHIFRRYLEGYNKLHARYIIIDITKNKIYERSYLKAYASITFAG